MTPILPSELQEDTIENLRAERNELYQESRDYYKELCIQDQIISTQVADLRALRKQKESAAAAAKAAELKAQAKAKEIAAQVRDTSTNMRMIFLFLPFLTTCLEHFFEPFTACF